MQNLSTREQEIQEVEVSVEQARGFIALGDALDRLEKNPDFIKVVQENYFLHEAARTVSLIAHPAQQREVDQAKLMSYLRGISEFQQYLITVRAQTEQFRINLADGLSLLDELHNPDPQQEA